MAKRLSILIFCVFLGVLGGYITHVYIADVPTELVSPVISIIRIPKPRMIGFLPYWLLSKADTSYADTLTNITYFGLALETDGSIKKMVNSQEEEPGWTTLRSGKLSDRFAHAIQRKQSLSLLVHLMDEDKIQKLIIDPETHANNLITDITPIMHEYSFSDLHLDIESFVPSTPGAQVQFSAFVREVKRHMDEKKLGTLTIDVPPISLLRPRLADLTSLSKIVDYIVLMTYDYHYTGSYLAGPVAPIAGGGVVREFDVTQAVEAALRVVPKEKLILGQPLYGYEWDTIASHSGAPVVPGTGKTASNRRIFELLASCDLPACYTGHDEMSGESYVIRDQLGYFSQIFYEDTQSLKGKLSLMKRYALTGVAFWALGYEEMHGLKPLTNFY